MTVTATTAPSEVLAPRAVSVARGYRFELVKLLAQWRVRILIGLCWIGPTVTVVVVSGQSTLPADTLFGREIHATGWAGALVVLSFAGSWFFPLLTSVVAGDVFSSEDRLGTWRHLLVAVRSSRRIFMAKSLASLTILLICVPGLAVSGIIGGLVVGSRPLTGLDGQLLSPADAAGRLLLAWLCALAPVLAFAAIGLLATSFAHLYRVQSQEVNHLSVTEAQLGATASCTKGADLVAQDGPGNDWRCYVYWHLPGVHDATGQAVYQLDVNANGRYVADGDGPNEVNGYFVVHTQYGDAPNPLWQFDGLVDLLATTSKG